MAAGEAVVGVAALAGLRDNLYLLGAALADGNSDLLGDPSPAEIRKAYEELAFAVTEVLRIRIELLALGSDG